MLLSYCIAALLANTGIIPPYVVLVYRNSHSRRKHRRFQSVFNAQEQATVCSVQCLVAEKLAGGLRAFMELRNRKEENGHVRIGNIRNETTHTLLFGVCAVGATASANSVFTSLLLPFEYKTWTKKAKQSHLPDLQYAQPIWLAVSQKN